MPAPKRILIISFKYLGDLVIAVPALRALKEHYPDCELHVLTVQEAIPLLDQIPWIKKVWGLPRMRDKAMLRKSWPVILKLRALHFDRSVDFVGNDRGAILSWLCGARLRLAPLSPKGFFGRRYCYNQTMVEAPGTWHEIKRDLHILSAWKIPPPRSLKLELRANPFWDDFAKNRLPHHEILAHISTSQQKKEWPVSHWAALYKMVSETGNQMIFSAGPSDREQQLLQTAKKIIPNAPILPVVSDLGAYLAVLQRAQIFVTGDTGPMHFALGLGVPTVALFGPSSFVQWSPLDQEEQTVRGTRCTCNVHATECYSAQSCMAAISPEEVFQKIRLKLEAAPAKI
ncbi:MAG: glycosyltransferase family 9 protein [Verrucomicrobiota bacterium]|nr:glycosyltransferase family 9 protein [Verrucomicrobiota bacterium]